MMESKRSDKHITGFMFYKTTKNYVDQCRAIFGDKVADDFCFEIMYRAIRGKQRIQLPPEVEAVMCSIAPLIEKSRERCAQTIEETETRRQQWLSKKPRNATKDSLSQSSKNKSEEDPSD